MSNNTINNNELMKKCRLAYTHVQLQGQYAAEQLESLLSENVLDEDELLHRSKITNIFLKDLQKKLLVYIEDIDRLSSKVKLEHCDDETERKTFNASCEESKESKETKKDDDDDQSKSNDSITHNPGEVNLEKEVDSDEFRKQCKALLNLNDDSLISDLDLGSISDISSHSSLNTSLSSSDHKNKSVNTKSAKNYKELFNLKSCSVLLERITHKQEDLFINSSDNDVDSSSDSKSLNRLLNLNNLKRKRKHLSDTSSSSVSVNSLLKLRKKKTKKVNVLDSELSTEDLMSDNTACNDADVSLDLLNPNPSNDDNSNDHLKDMLDNINESDGSVFQSSSSSGTDSNTRSSEKETPFKKKTKRRHESSEGDKSSSKSKKELDERKRWRRDSLLTMRIVSDSSDENVVDKKKDNVLDSDSDNGDVSKKKNVNNSEESSNDSNSGKINKRKEILISSESSDDSSDVTFVEQIALSSPKGKNHRKNIRAVISDEVLEKATLAAQREEVERVKRLQPQKEMLTQSLSQYSEEFGHILDVDKKTGEPLVVVDAGLTKRLKDHQLDGVRFMWENCYESLERLKTSKGTGCILAHCMGLGKSFQVTALVHTLFKYQETHTNHVLIVCPLSTVLNWENEFNIAFKAVSGANVELNVFVINDRISKFEKYKVVHKWHNRRGVLIVGYEAFVSLVRECTHESKDVAVKAAYKSLINPGADLIVCDEGHLIKNENSKRKKALMRVQTKRRIVLTGTPLQNNLKEYYQMVQFVKPNLLGTFKEFSNRFINPINNGSYHDSTLYDIKLMRQRSHILHEVLKSSVQRFEVSTLQQYLPEKLDYVLFINLNKVQVDLYKTYLALTKEQHKDIRRFISDAVLLRSVWTHPYILELKDQAADQKKERQQKEIDVLHTEPEAHDPPNVPRDWWRGQYPADAADNVGYGPKISVTLSIVEECRKVNDKLLVFSQNLSVLNALEHFLTNVGTSDGKKWVRDVDYLRIDGAIQPEKRVKRYQKFAEDPNLSVLLMTQQVGGMGLNIVAANRIILMDVNFNPATDMQSIFRIYRFGQEKKCYVYRLVSMGTMEEVIYERSVTKSAMSARVIDEQQINRHYNSTDLQEMYRFRPVSEQPKPLLRVPQDVLLASILESRSGEIFKYHEHQALLENLPEEQLNEEEQKLAWEEFRKEQELSRHPAVPPPVVNVTNDGGNQTPQLGIQYIQQNESNVLNNFTERFTKSVNDVLAKIREDSAKKNLAVDRDEQMTIVTNDILGPVAPSVPNASAPTNNDAIPSTSTARAEAQRNDAVENRENLQTKHVTKVRILKRPNKAITKPANAALPLTNVKQKLNNNNNKNLIVKTIFPKPGMYRKMANETNSNHRQTINGSSGARTGNASVIAKNPNKIAKNIDENAKNPIGNAKNLIENAKKPIENTNCSIENAKNPIENKLPSAPMLKVANFASLLSKPNMEKLTAPNSSTSRTAPAAPNLPNQQRYGAGDIIEIED